MKKWLIAIILICLVFIVAIFMNGCAPEKTTTTTEVKEKTKETPTTTSTTQQETEKQPSIEDRGDFKVVYAPISNPDYAKYQQIFKNAQTFEEIANALNGELALPTDITIVLKECGIVNAYYDPQTNELNLCYELIDHFGEIFSPYVKSDEELGEAVAGATFFTFFHEMGHALVHVLELPITGKEEDAVDQLSVITLAESDTEDAALSAATWFFVQGAEKGDIEELAFWDEHSLDMQRFYNIVCWIYGKNPEKYSYIIDEGILPQDRAIRCPGEYQQMLNSWNRLLEPYTKE
jgi:hypothetical protein